MSTGSQVNLELLAVVHKALGDVVRLRILQLLPYNTAACEALYNVNDISQELGMPQPTISHHLKILRQAGLIRFTKECNSVYYYLDLRSLRNSWRELHDHVLRRI